MRPGALAGFLLLCLAAPGASAKGYGDLSVIYEYAAASEPLTVDLIARLDPGQPDPQLRRWVLSRTVALKGLSSRPAPKGRVRVKASTLDAKSEAYFRPAGPWYQTIGQFPCFDAKEAKRPRLFETEAGAVRSAEASSKLWEKILAARKLALSVELSRIVAPDPRAAWESAQRIFQEWLDRADREWRAKVASDVASVEWKGYEAQARDQGVCGHRAAAQGEPSPDRWMSVDPGAAVPAQPLTHAPARRWQGYFSVRMDVRIGDRGLNGQFLIDPFANRSLLSPDWLLSQGAQPAWLEIPEALPEHVRSGAGSGLSGLGKPAKIQEAVLSGMPLLMNRFDIFDTDLFDEPETAAPCCSGVLGRDFLRRYVVEFHPGKPREVELWPLEHFRAPDEYAWVEARESGKGELKVSCTGRARALGDGRICENPTEVLTHATGPVIFDLPHGKIWYSRKELQAPSFRNTTGLRVEYTYVNGDRVLAVKGLGGTPTARALQRQGLRKGMVISQVDSDPAPDLDLWEVNRRLAGVDGDSVTLRWKTRHGLKAVSVPVGAARSGATRTGVQSAKTRSRPQTSSCREATAIRDSA